MRVGTKSLLVGVHNIVWHPVTVILAWRELYGTWPNWKELVCIVIHDWGYWGSPNMDGPEGEDHPEFAAELAHRWLDKKGEDVGDGFVIDCSDEFWEYWLLCLYHSRHYARRDDEEPSKLCWADKLSIKYDPRWFYLLRAQLSGELEEYMALHSRMGESFKTPEEWYDWASDRAIRLGKQMSSEGISFHPRNEPETPGPVVHGRAMPSSMLTAEDNPCVITRRGCINDIPCGQCGIYMVYAKTAEMQGIPPVEPEVIDQISKGKASSSRAFEEVAQELELDKP